MKRIFSVLALAVIAAVGAASAAPIKHDANWHAIHDDVKCCPLLCPTPHGCG